MNVGVHANWKGLTSVFATANDWGIVLYSTHSPYTTKENISLTKFSTAAEWCYGLNTHHRNTGDSYINPATNATTAQPHTHIYQFISAYFISTLHLLCNARRAKTAPDWMLNANQMPLISVRKSGPVWFFSLKIGNWQPQPVWTRYNWKRAKTGENSSFYNL